MQIDWWTLALQTINFLIVIWLLTRFLYRPVRRIIEAREAADRKASDDAADKAEEAEKARQAYEEKRAALEEEARKTDAAFRGDIEAERVAILEEARKTAEEMLTKARDRIERDKDAALVALRGQIADLAASLARKALEDRPATSRDAIARAAAQIDELPETERADLLRDLDAENAALTVVTAVSLTDRVQGEWRKALSERFGGDIRTAFEVDPDILGGALLRYPHAVFDFSVAGRLDRAVEALEA